MSSFSFKQFHIVQSHSAMKVGTDGVILGAWFDAGNSDKDRILDIGCGTGLIALMAAQRNVKASIDAVEIDAESCRDARNNIESSPWSHRVNLYNISFQDYAAQCGITYSRIVSNPPYFVNSLVSPDYGRSVARHTDTLSFGDLLGGVLSLLSGGGLFSVILPVIEGKQFAAMASDAGLFLHRRLDVYPNENTDVKRVVMEFGRENIEPQYENLVIENGSRHNYSNEYIDLTKEFYLKF